MKWSRVYENKSVTCVGAKFVENKKERKKNGQRCLQDKKILLVMLIICFPQGIVLRQYLISFRKGWSSPLLKEREDALKHLSLAFDQLLSWVPLGYNRLISVS
jgi:hypothetical protein